MSKKEGVSLRTFKNYLLIFVFAAVGIAAFAHLLPGEKQETVTVAGEYTGGELMDFAAALHCDIDTVTSEEVTVLTKSDTSRTCKKTLLNYTGKVVFFFGADELITKANFIFPAATPWNDVSNRISEQLGEASAAALYDNGGADAQWENQDYLFYLVTDGKTMTLSVSKYYGGDH
ncbi:MAG TPA: hypothetical protein PKD52_01870 [Clostridiales bacterium]|nr:hypothetical protein [Clostridiales bacterium]